jgi:membrane protein implicated in regulation of membrane protease activity
MCFKHLENRDRPSVIEGNVSWWLASAISVPSVLATLIYIRRRQKRKESERIQREEQERQERELLIKR